MAVPQSRKHVLLTLYAFLVVVSAEGQLEGVEVRKVVLYVRVQALLDHLLVVPVRQRRRQVFQLRLFTTLRSLR